jgi:hypothetical protein
MQARNVGPDRVDRAVVRLTTGRGTRSMALDWRVTGSFAGEGGGLEVEEQGDGDDAWKGKTGSEIDEYGRRQSSGAVMSATGTCPHCLLHGTQFCRAPRFQIFVDSPSSIFRLLNVNKGQPWGDALAKSKKSVATGCWPGSQDQRSLHAVYVWHVAEREAEMSRACRLGVHSCCRTCLGDLVQSGD